MALHFDKDGKILVPKGIDKEKEVYKGSILLLIRGKEFLFDKETADKFKNKFNVRGEAYVDKGYLLRKNLYKKKESFHRWLMKEEIEEFVKQKDIQEKYVEVHHKNLKCTDNRQRNLECREKKDHRALHMEEKAWEIYRKTKQEFWSSGVDENLKRKKFKHNWNVTHLAGVNHEMRNGWIK
ncbi:MAG: hypothetical protein IIA87_04920 [Nanoarchaeota archaeon]|nr:hypothetical protein [Nanoarchaeota archaeon]